jgi:hypothetical protein
LRSDIVPNQFAGCGIHPRSCSDRYELAYFRDMTLRSDRVHCVGWCGPFDFRRHG